MSATTLRRLARLERMAKPDPGDDWESYSDEITHAGPFFRMLGLHNIANCLEKFAASQPEGWRPDTRSDDERAAELRCKLGME